MAYMQQHLDFLTCHFQKILNSFSYMTEIMYSAFYFLVAVFLSLSRIVFLQPNLGISSSELLFRNNSFRKVINLVSDEPFIFINTATIFGARESVADWGTLLQAGTSQFRFSFSFLNPCSHTMALGVTRPVTEVSKVKLSP
jgi:hypothetical protein